MTNRQHSRPNFTEIEGLLATRAIREAFKYTPATKLFNALVETSSDHTASLTGTNDLEVTQQPASDLINPKYPFVHVSRTLAGEHHQVVVPEGVKASEALQINHARLSNTWLDIRLQKNAELTLIESEVGDGSTSSNISITLEQGARLHHHRCLLSEDTNQYHACMVDVQANAHYQLNHYCGGSKLRRVDQLVRLMGEKASVHMVGAYGLAKKSHLDQFFSVEHHAAHCQSDHVINGICLDGGRSSFNGRIHILPNAQKSEAHLTNKNLMLGSTAVINTKPELEIYADDVICSHGATVGQLDANAVFYLRSRGIPDNQAKVLLANAFLTSQVGGELRELAASFFSTLLAARELDE